MALRPCRECGKEISSEALTCPNCGLLMPSVEPPSRASIDAMLAKGDRQVRLLYILAAVIFIGGIVVFALWVSTVESFLRASGF